MLVSEIALRSLKGVAQQPSVGSAALPSMTCESGTSETLSISSCRYQVNVLTSSGHVTCPLESQDLSSPSLSVNCSSGQLAGTALSVALLAQRCNFLSALSSRKWNHWDVLLHLEVPKQNEALQAGEKGGWEELPLQWGGKLHILSVIASDNVSKHTIKCVLDLPE